MLTFRSNRGLLLSAVSIRPKIMPDSGFFFGGIFQGFDSLWAQPPAPRKAAITTTRNSQVLLNFPAMSTSRTGVSLVSTQSRRRLIVADIRGVGIIRGQ